MENNKLDYELAKDAIFESFSQDLFNEVSKLIGQYGEEQLGKLTLCAMDRNIQVTYCEEMPI